jgi:hypothetical protein
MSSTEKLHGYVRTAMSKRPLLIRYKDEGSEAEPTTRTSCHKRR